MGTNRAFYKEYRVNVPGTPGGGNLCVIVHNDTGATYYTWTHYGDHGSPSFVRIR
jgi:guanyl-specific ribonuclease Sa